MCIAVRAISLEPRSFRYLSSANMFPCKLNVSVWQHVKRMENESLEISLGPRGSHCEEWLLEITSWRGLRIPLSCTFSLWAHWSMQLLCNTIISHREQELCNLIYHSCNYNIFPYLLSLWRLIIINNSSPNKQCLSIIICVICSSITVHLYKHIRIRITATFWRQITGC